MKRFNTRMRATVLAATLAVALAGCAGSGHSPSTGDLVDDSVITAKVKSALFNANPVLGTNVSVETHKGRVQLAGFVKTPDERQRAAGLARNVAGVREVSNHIELR